MQTFHCLYKMWQCHLLEVNDNIENNISYGYFSHCNFWFFKIWGSVPCHLYTVFLSLLLLWYSSFIIFTIILSPSRVRRLDSAIWDASVFLTFRKCIHFMWEPISGVGWHVIWSLGCSQILSRSLSPLWYNEWGDFFLILFWKSQ